MENVGGEASSRGMFIVDLRGLELSDEQLESMNDAIHSAVQTKLSEITDLEGSPLAALGPGVLGLVLRR